MEKFLLANGFQKMFPCYFSREDIGTLLMVDKTTLMFDQNFCLHDEETTLNIFNDLTNQAKNEGVPFLIIFEHSLSKTAEPTKFPRFLGTFSSSEEEKEFEGFLSKNDSFPSLDFPDFEFLPLFDLTHKTFYLKEISLDEEMSISEKRFFESTEPLEFSSLFSASRKLISSLKNVGFIDLSKFSNAVREKFEETKKEKDFFCILEASFEEDEFFLELTFLTKKEADQVIESYEIFFDSNSEEESPYLDFENFTFYDHIQRAPLKGFDFVLSDSQKTHIKKILEMQKIRQTLLR